MRGKKAPPKSPSVVPSDSEVEDGLPEPAPESGLEDGDKVESDVE